MKHLLITATVAMSLATSAMATTLTDTFSSFVVLGDSLSDNGNLFDAIGVPGAPYVDGRFSNGPVWNEGIAQEFIDAGQLSANFAFGGATTSGGALPPSVDLQALNFGAIPPLAAGARPLVSIWAGANDIRDTLQSANPFGAPAAGITAANSISNTITTLSGLGVNDFLVFNLPDLGVTAELFGTAGAPLGSASSNAFNAQLASNIDALEADGINIIEVDIFAFLNEVIANPTDFGFDNVTQACIFNLDTCNPDTWLFFDGIHPTAVAHAQIEALVRAELTVSAVPLPAGAPLYLVGIAGFGLIARRRRG